jgi:hypothetical protein
MKFTLFILAFFLGVSTASAWWLEVLWGYRTAGFWVIPVFLTSVTVLLASACVDKK